MLLRNEQRFGRQSSSGGVKLTHKKLPPSERKSTHSGELCRGQQKLFFELFLTGLWMDLFIFRWHFWWHFVLHFGAF
jgi:hypothetical protein